MEPYFRDGRRKELQKERNKKYDQEMHSLRFITNAPEGKIERKEGKVANYVERSWEERGESNFDE